MSKNKPHFADAKKRGEMHQKAVAFARTRLEADGIKYPVYDNALTAEENYGKILSYAEQEAALVVQFMKEPSGPRPLVLDTTKQKDEWRQYND